MNAGEIVLVCSQNANLPFLVIGGFAVIAHGYARSTTDLDFLVRRAQQHEWQAQLAEHGYRIVHQQNTFAQFASEQSMNVDLMFVNDETFDKMWKASEVKIVKGKEARFPTLEHLIALKLHVCKQNIPHRILRDMDDVLTLINLNGVDLRKDNWRELFKKYGTIELYEKILGPGNF
jgi:hypothetical protein